jgi:primosomal protein N' (replication factor Y)
VYADVALPVPLDQPFTYLLPETLRHRVRTGCRLIVPFGPRKLTGVIVNTHDTRPAGPVKEALRLLDEEPVLEDHLISLGRWIAGYYCAPIGEVLRVMTPLGGEIRSTRMYSLTDAGRDAARQLLFGTDTEDATIQVLRLLERRSLSSTYLTK